MSKRWSVREKHIMRALGLKPQPGSGSGWLHKEDGESDDLLVQLKSTEKDSMSVKRLVWDTLWRNARAAHKTPVLILDFVDPDHDLMLIACRRRDLEVVAKSLAT